MPVVDGVFEPRTVLTAAERAVDFLSHNTHIEQRRAAVETYAAPVVKRLAHTIVFTHAHPVSLTDDLAARLEASLRRTAAFGYTEARKEVRALRTGDTPRAQYVLPDAGDHANAVEGGMPGVRALLKRRARQAADHVTRAVQADAVKQQGEDKLLAVASAAKAGARALHNSVLELVGETLNLGRTAGAMSMGPPPEFALRSEQLDKNTCDACTRMHGTIDIVGSDAFYRDSPPSECYGGGRCRGLWIFGDTADQMSVAEAA
jgi:hypothetical protein